MTMKLNLAITIAVVMFFGVGKTSAEVTINEVPLKHQDVSRLDGGALYDNLCAACHGASGKGDGPAAGQLAKGVPDLTVLSARNGGTFPHRKVESVICGKSRKVEHGTIDMPIWGQQFAYLRTGWTGFPKNAYVRNRAHTLATYVESIQLDNATGHAVGR